MKYLEKINTERVFPAELEERMENLAHMKTSSQDAMFDARDEFDTLSDFKDPTMYEIANKIKDKEDCSITEALRQAKGSEEWKDYLTGLGTARAHYRDMLVKYNNIHTLWETTRSILSSKNKER